MLVKCKNMFLPSYCKNTNTFYLYYMIYTNSKKLYYLRKFWYYDKSLCKVFISFLILKNYLLKTILAIRGNNKLGTIECICNKIVRGRYITS